MTRKCIDTANTLNERDPTTGQIYCKKHIGTSRAYFTQDVSGMTLIVKLHSIEYANQNTLFWPTIRRILIEKEWPVCPHLHTTDTILQDRLFENTVHRYRGIQRNAVEDT
jgi:hypothetical protein